MGGVTASGKTELSLEWAERNNAEIISCDSVSFYRGLDIGSAKPDSSEQKRVVHHGLDLADVSEVFDVGQFHAYAKEVIQGIISKGKKVLVVGGSGFFLHGFLRPVVDDVEVSAEIRGQVDATYEKEGLGCILAQLREYNPKGLGNLDTQNPLRVIRALERCLQSGRSLIDLQKDFQKLPIPYAQFQKKLVWLNREDDEIMERINLRTKRMIEGGMLEETEQGIREGMESHPSLSQSVGYREVIEFHPRARTLLPSSLNKPSIESRSARSRDRIIDAEVPDLWMKHLRLSVNLEMLRDSWQHARGNVRSKNTIYNPRHS